MVQGNTDEGIKALLKGAAAIVGAILVGAVAILLVVSFLIGKAC